MKTLVIDIGGTHVKLLATGRRRPLSQVADVLRSVADWEFENVSIGYQSCSATQACATDGLMSLGGGNSNDSTRPRRAVGSGITRTPSVVDFACGRANQVPAVTAGHARKNFGINASRNES